MGDVGYVWFVCAMGEGEVMEVDGCALMKRRIFLLRWVVAVFMAALLLLLLYLYREIRVSLRESQLRTSRALSCLLFPSIAIRGLGVAMCCSCLFLGLPRCSK